MSVIVEWMKTFGFAVDKKEVMASEFEVFKVVRWTVSETPIERGEPKAFHTRHLD